MRSHTKAANVVIQLILFKNIFTKYKNDFNYLQILINKTFLLLSI